MPNRRFASRREIERFFPSARLALRSSSKFSMSASHSWSLTNSSYGKTANCFLPFFVRISGCNVIGRPLGGAAPDKLPLFRLQFQTALDNFRRETQVSSLYVASEIVRQIFNLGENPAPLLFWNPLKILERTRLELYRIPHHSPFSASLNFFTTSNSLPRSSMTFTAICLCSPATNGSLVVPARCSHTLSAYTPRNSRFKLSHAAVRGKNACATQNASSL